MARSHTLAASAARRRLRKSSSAGQRPSGSQGRCYVGAIPGLRHQVEIQRAAMLEKVVDLLSAPAPGMMLAHQRPGGVNGALIVRVLSISVETLGQIRTVQ
jgi:hypothetical protein